MQYTSVEGEKCNQLKRDPNTKHCETIIKSWNFPITRKRVNCCSQLVSYKIQQQTHVSSVNLIFARSRKTETLERT